MKLSSRTKIAYLFIGDVAALYVSLILTLLVRYGNEFYGEFIEVHVIPFSIIFPVWLLVFYVAGLYDLPRLRNNLDFIKTLALALFINALATTAIFYFIPYFTIAPKTNLFIFIAVLAALQISWRRAFNVRAQFREGLNKVLLLGEDSTAKEIVEAIRDIPQIGYEIKLWLKNNLTDKEARELPALVRDNEINLIVVPPHLKENKKLISAFYELLRTGITAIDITAFYEAVFRKLPVRHLDEAWFLENKIGEKRFYDEIKQALEFASAIALGIVLLPLELFLAILIKLTSAGPVIYRQTRIGAREKEFTLYKFRTMRIDAETNGPQWASVRDDRTTGLGRFLRYTHLDELPQLVNIMKGELSFVGPRPERPEFVRTLEEEIPHYALRHLIKPGITGWAQINYRYGSSIEDAEEKLKYDMYYMKNRSIIIDIAILLKTIRSFFVNHT